MSEWSIKIVPAKTPGPNLKAKFIPQLQENGPTVLNVSKGDIISWNNTTDDLHQPVAADASYQPLGAAPGTPQYLSDAIPAGESSEPAWIANAAAVPTTVYYVCAYHKDEHGIITVTD
jgi:plastocyanin